MNVSDKGSFASERRKSLRMGAVLPIEIPFIDALGETVDISEGGARLKFKQPLSSDPGSILLNSTTSELLNIKIQIIWKQVWEKALYYAVRFLDFSEDARNVLRDGLLRYRLIDPEFVNLIIDVRHFLLGAKLKFDMLDAKDIDGSQGIDFIKSNKKEIFNRLNKYFNKIGEITKDLDKKSYDIYQHYFYQALEPLLGRGMEINTHIHQKPLGYPGDYEVQNYILDYHTGRYLGKSSYQKLINHYTCNIPISKSNVSRKDFFKVKVLDTLKEKEGTKILSVGSGPLRELIELVEEGRIDKPLLFKCIDFEERTLQYIKNRLQEAAEEKKQFLKIDYIHKSISHLIRNGALKEWIGKQDMVYSSGLFDYFTDRLASNFVQRLFSLLTPGGVLIVCNASLKDASVRPYYEMLGGWVFYHRTKEELLAWTKNIKTLHEIKFEGPADGRCYLYMHLKRKR